ncbi:3'(2'),5'-bisphosphate nucleotidase CysQ [Marihabitans asiaticum]|uniref:3'(2'),5-bisphosphonucleoside 3'(2')-phosphohydrolase n=1 Tax=Marihabitans asiaticum TaxID=415218 RepID=A0A560W8H8_9MICO|nr:inositol monophosphatase family protein [Marihabitans asiaticum]TWD13918.1 3'(2'), 5'-bisphosphate nucleotidase [Marihabitans asiaticum]
MSHDAAARLAREAGEALLQVRRDNADLAASDPKALKDLGDATSQALLARLLAEHFPGDAVLSGEAADSSARLSAERVWIIDPLDGTREFSEAGRPDWAVHVALWAKGDLLADRLGATLMPMGSAGVKAMSVVDGEADAYVHAGGQYEWDSAAPVAVARAHGLHTSRVDGAPLEYNRPDPWLPDLLVCRPEVAEEILDAIRASSPSVEQT